MGTTKDTFKHAAIYSFAAILGKMISFLMLPFYAHILRDIGYGIIGMVDISLSFLMSLLSYGLQGGIVRFYHDEPDENKARVVSTGTLLIGGATFSLVLIVMLFSKPLSTFLLGDSEHYLLLCLALGGFAFDLTGQGAASILIIKRRSLLFSLLGLIRLFVGLSLNIYLIIILKLGLWGYFVSSLVMGIVTGTIFVVISIRECGLVFDRRLARELIRFQLPLVPGSLTSFVSRQVERVVVRFQINLETVGVLEMGYKFPVLLSLLISSPFMQSWNTKRTEIADQPGAPEWIGRMYTYYLFLMLFAGLIMAVNIRGVLQLLTPPEFWPAYRVSLIEIVTMILEGSYFHFVFGLYYAKATKSMALVRAVTSVFKIGLAYLFISLWGLYGAAFSACATNAILLAWGGAKARAKYAFLIEYKKILTMICSAVAIFILLDRTDLSSFGLTVFLRDNVFPGLIDLLADGPLGSWKEGKVILILGEKSALMSLLTVKTLASFSFVIFFPVVHEETWRKLQARVRALFAR
ncbi:MAG: oligosaccharide flippase family protein [bacterium]